MIQDVCFFFLHHIKLTPLYHIVLSTVRYTVKYIETTNFDPNFASLRLVALGSLGGAVVASPSVNLDVSPSSVSVRHLVEIRLHSECTPRVCLCNTHKCYLFSGAM